VKHTAQWLLVIAVGAGLWLTVTVPTGFPVSELAAFAGPGVVLAIAMSWSANSLRRSEWSWRSALHAAAAGAILYPPLVAFVTAWGGTLGEQAMVVLFVMTSWVVLGAGAFGAILRWLLEEAPAKVRRHRHIVVVHPARSHR
jgi:hypothetical protein